MASVDEIQVLDLAAGPELAIVEGDGAARAVVWPGVGATLRSLHTISLAADAHTVELRHPSEAVYYAASGTGTAIDRASGEEHELVTGAMVHIDAGTPYVLRAGTGGLELLGGPSPADERLYERGS
jgi:mannose-6-phosphate isomerase-like protein (cupin superfamily)